MFWDLPGTQRYLAAAVESLRRGRHVLLVLPDIRRDESLVPRLLEGVRLSGDGELTPLCGAHEAVDPLGWVVEQFGLPCHTVATVGELLKCELAPSRYVMIQGIPDEGDVAVAWSRFFSRIAESAQGLDGPSLVFSGTVGPRFPVPAKNVRLDVSDFWGVLGDVDVELVVGDSLRRFPPPTVASRFWARALCRGFAAGDPELAAALVERLPRDPVAVAAVIRDARPLAGSAESASVPVRGGNMGAFLSHRAPDPPRNGHDRFLWARGLLDWQEGRGYTLSSAISCSADDKELDRRLWAGQQEVFLPLVERVRCEACDTLRRLFGERWAESLGTGASLDIDSVRDEIGGLARLVNRRGLRGRVPDGLIDSVLRWRDIRNSLSHREYVRLASLETAFDEYRKLVSSARSCGARERVGS